jgi:hypothetical protein
VAEADAGILRLSDEGEERATASASAKANAKANANANANAIANTGVSPLRITKTKA